MKGLVVNETVVPFYWGSQNENLVTNKLIRVELPPKKIQAQESS